jgi:hypothetical protein
VISLKANPNKNELTVYWESIDSPEKPIDHYQLVVNGTKKEIVNFYDYNFYVFLCPSATGDVEAELYRINWLF